MDLDPSASEFFTHQPDLGSSSGSSMGHAARSQCPALRGGASAADYPQNALFHQGRGWPQLDPVHDGALRRLWGHRGFQQPPLMPTHPGFSHESMPAFPTASAHTNQASNTNQASQQQQQQQQQQPPPPPQPQPPPPVPQPQQQQQQPYQQQYQMPHNYAAYAPAPYFHNSSSTNNSSNNRQTIPSLSSLGSTVLPQSNQGNSAGSSQTPAGADTSSTQAHAGRANNHVAASSAGGQQFPLPTLFRYGPASHSHSHFHSQTSPLHPLPRGRDLAYPIWVGRDLGMDSNSQTGDSSESGSALAGSPSPAHFASSASPHQEARDQTDGNSDTPSPHRVPSGRPGTRGPRYDMGSMHAMHEHDNDWSSEDESDPDSNILASMALAPGADVAEARLRTQQLLRGAANTGKRVASQRAIASLQSVDISELPESERTCVICYNDFGVANPEGINEAPLRLPKCKHVFGDHCIKKWFEESDSCPYCRDKVPSEPQHRSVQPQHYYRLMRHQTMQAHQMQQAQVQVLREHSMREYRERELREQGLLREAIDSYPSSRMSGPVYGPPMDLPGMLPPGIPHHNYHEFSTRARNYEYSTSSHPWFGPGPERRSPPTDFNENHRRTRPRHGSLRGSPPTGRMNPHAVPVSTHQVQSPVRQPRPPLFPHAGLSPDLDVPMTDTQQSPWSSRPASNHNHNHQTATLPGRSGGGPPQYIPHQMTGPPGSFLNPLADNVLFGNTGRTLPELRDPVQSPPPPTAAEEDDFVAHYLNRYR
ncbi:hypothetical protein F4778DRAFT_360672 [Xylariomycetidae sp. FL2044]|nr:hypothetical protein F4778DRAFT_360672 [Xylariomycetidae sp. FL2044]